MSSNSLYVTLKGSLYASWGPFRCRATWTLHADGAELAAGGLRYTAQAFFANWAAVLLLVLVAQSLGLVIGALVPFPKTAQTITTVVALSMVLVAGFFVTGVPVWIGWLKWIRCLVLHSAALHCGDGSGADVHAPGPGCSWSAMLQSTHGRLLLT